MKKIIIIIPIILSLLFVFNACSEKNNFNQYGSKDETTTISSKELYSIAEQGLKRESDYSLEDYKSIDYKYNEKITNILYTVHRVMMFWEEMQ